MLGDNLKYLRKKHKMTQGELGLRLRISRSAVGLYETDKRRPDLETLLQIADLFDVSIDWLLDRKTTGLANGLAQATRGLSNSSLAELEQYAEYLRFMESEVHNARQLASVHQRQQGTRLPSKNPRQ